MEPRRIKGIIGIDMPLRSIEEVADADGASPDWPESTERTWDSGAAVREGSLLRTRSRRAANNPDARSRQMRVRRD